MNHQKVYDNIIQNAQNRNRESGIYYENHHIIPRCMGGSDKKENLVLLTAREHFVCHKLLTYIYKGDSVGRKNKAPWNKGLKLEYKPRGKQKE